MTFVGSSWGLRKKEVDAVGHTVESRSKAQLGLGITVPYNINTTKLFFIEGFLIFPFKLNKWRLHVKPSN